MPPTGSIIVPLLGNLPEIEAFSSHDGGANWSAPVKVARATAHQGAGNCAPIRCPSHKRTTRERFPWRGRTAVFGQVRFERFRVKHRRTASIGKRPATIPIDAVGSTFDHIIPGLGISIQVQRPERTPGLAYYYPSPNQPDGLDLRVVRGIHFLSGRR